MVDPFIILLKLVDPLIVIIVPEEPCLPDTYGPTNRALNGMT